MKGPQYGVSYGGSLISLVRTIFAGVELAIILRALLIFFKASESTLFVQWVNEITNPLLRPFVGIFPSVKVGSGFVIEFYALFALIVYAFIGYVLVEMLTIYNNHRADKKSRKGN